MKLENMASAAANVGSSRRVAAGVPVRDLDRRVDFPKEPVSGTVLLGARRDPPSVLERMVSLKYLEDRETSIPRE